MNTQRLNVLFVDDEPSILEGLRRLVRCRRDEWLMRFSTSGEEALRELEKQPADVVVSDMRMPTMDGTTLLSEVRRRWPSTVRIILSGQTEQGQLLNSIGAIHQFVQKPCDTEQLSTVIDRVRRLASLIESPELRGMAAYIESLPVRSASYTKLMALSGRNDADMERMVEIVSEDIGLVTKLLQLTNSAFFGLARRVTGARKAVQLLGFNQIKAIAMTSAAFDVLTVGCQDADLIDRLWRASTDIGAAATSFARHVGTGPDQRDTAQLAGTLSLIGRALLIRQFAHQWHAAHTVAEVQGISLSSAEYKTFGASQEQVGAYALGLWAFDDAVVESVLYQARPSLAPRVNDSHPLRSVHMARAQDVGEALADPPPLDDEWMKGNLKEAA